MIVGFNDGYVDDDGMFAPTSIEVANTVKTYNLAFCNEWSINTNDTAAGLPGILYGRYPGDTYAGGNPWVLTTAALANLFYRGAIEIASNKALPDAAAQVDANGQCSCSELLTFGSWQAVWTDVFGETFPSTVADAADMFLRAGDSVLLRLYEHVQPNGFHLYEQLDR